MLGYFHSMALDVNGGVWTWGENYFGKSGDGSQSGLAYNGDANYDTGPSHNNYVPVKVTGLSDVVTIYTVAGWYNIAVRQDGSAWFWGKDNVLSFSNGETANQLIPKELPELFGVKSIVSSHYSSIILKNDGTVWSLGYNKFGQLGNGTKVDHMKPVQVSGLSDIIGITNNEESSYALKKDGTVWAWGRNDHGQLGNRNRYLFLTPQQIIFNKETIVMDKPIEVFVDDVLIRFKTPPKTMKDSLYMPYVELTAKLGYSSSPQGKLKFVLKKGNEIIVIENRSKTILINKKEVLLDKPVIISDGQFWLPVGSVKTVFKVKLNY